MGRFDKDNEDDAVNDDSLSSTCHQFSLSLSLSLSLWPDVYLQGLITKIQTKEGSEGGWRGGGGGETE